MEKILKFSGYTLLVIRYHPYCSWIYCLNSFTNNWLTNLHFFLQHNQAVFM